MSRISPQNCAHVLSGLLASLLAGEKEQTRSWLRVEMDQLVEPMLDSLFKRLTKKLMDNVDLMNQSGDGAGDRTLVDSSVQVEPQQSVTLASKPSNSGITFFNPAYHDNNQKQTISNGQLSNTRSDKFVIKTEFDDDPTGNELIAISNQTLNPDIHSTNPTNNEQLNHLHNLSCQEVDNQVNLNHNQQQLVNQSFDQLESFNHQSVSHILKSSTINPLFDAAPHSAFDDKEEYDDELLAQVKREIEEEKKIEKKLKGSKFVRDYAENDTDQEDTTEENDVDHHELQREEVIAARSNVKKPRLSHPTTSTNQIVTLQCPHPDSLNFAPNCRGKTCFYQGFEYNRERESKHKLYYKCSMSKMGCKARLHISPDKQNVLKTINQHSDQLAHPNRWQYYAFMAYLKGRALNGDEEYEIVLRKATQKFGTISDVSGCTEDSRKRFFRKYRRKRKTSQGLLSN